MSHMARQITILIIKHYIIMDMQPRKWIKCRQEDGCFPSLRVFALLGDIP